MGRMTGSTSPCNEGVIAMPYGPSFAEPAGPSGMHPREQISGNDQVYCLFDFGLGHVPKESRERDTSNRTLSAKGNARPASNWSSAGNKSK